MESGIMGSGGIGGYDGARLQSGGADVTFVARGAHLAAMQQNGIAIEGDKPLHLPKVKATADPSTLRKADMRAPIVGRTALLGGAAYVGVAIARPGVIRKTGAMERLAFGEYDNKVSRRAQTFLDAAKA